ncbi:uncharacterized protein HMPREF1541_10993 [Cyphellophora europaea CBS 101466]|uniref:Uncharacterized protein n=1 Tax=Cyphellophora europaea (strain CBS 101466) TaxID=1220924 RepID=W2S5B8_CYPE1|nr:uncharacterized protein HMPREF1541_10993 [Cyphellophora europaea CBS 101466]ETN43862.1 hypothetical protein HMPREF1541_10993 [Cyphellophora europaea CBS 101466]
MCQYDMGYTLRCTRPGCSESKFITQMVFRETDDKVVRMFKKYRKPCGCTDRWFRWHYYASKTGSYANHPIHKLCDPHRRRRRSAIRAWGRPELVPPDWLEALDKEYPPEKREPYPRNGKPPKKLHQGFFQEMNVHTGLPMATGRVIHHLAYNSDDGTSVSGVSTPKGGRAATVAAASAAAPSEPRVYLEDAERPTTTRVTTYQYDSRDVPDEANSDWFEDMSEDESLAKFVASSDADLRAAKEGKKKEEEATREFSGLPAPSTRPYHKVENKESDERLEDMLLRIAKFSADVDLEDKERGERIQEILDRISRMDLDTGEGSRSARGTETDFCVDERSYDWCWCVVNFGFGSAVCGE